MPAATTTPARDRPTRGPTAVERGLRHAHGFRVVGPEGDAGLVVGVRLSGQPPRALVLVVRDGDCMRLVSARRVAAVLTHEKKVLITAGAGMGHSPSGGLAPV
jgi:hypothetical protein